jgi:two-component system, NarL family, response regulator DevR
MSAIRVFLVDDHELMLIGLQEALESEPDIHVIGQTNKAEGAAERIAALEPDVILLDLRLSDGSGIELCREVMANDPNARCLVFTSATGEEPLLDSILAGASGYVLKDAPRAALIKAIHDVASGNSLIDPHLTSRVLDLVRQRNTAPLRRLTDREEMVFELMGAGMTNREIAEKLNLADQTVKNYVSRVLNKLQMDRTRAALYSAELARER